VTTHQMIRLPGTVDATESGVGLARDLIRAWPTGGIFQTSSGSDRVDAGDAYGWSAPVRQISPSAEQSGSVVAGNPIPSTVPSRRWNTGPRG